MNQLEAIPKELEYIEKNPRGAGYKDHRKDVLKLKERGIWDELATDASCKYLKKIAEVFVIPYSTVKDWYSKLHQNPNWIPRDP